jgi:transcriptional regulator with XRE-family HTH domain/quercetin dioxygenase-like cupin family protein
MVEGIGPALRAARLQQNLSLRSVAADVGVSASLLSQVETSKTQPSVSTFYALVNRLGISVDEIFGFAEQIGFTPKPTGEAVPSPAISAEASRGDAMYVPGDHSVVQRAGEHPKLEMESGVIWELLTVGDRSVVDALLVTYQAGASSSISKRMMRHEGVEYGYILQGELTLQLEFDTYVLRPGDSLCFDSTRPHMFANNGHEDVRGLWFVIGRRNGDPSQRAARLLAEADSREVETAPDSYGQRQSSALGRPRKASKGPVDRAQGGRTPSRQSRRARPDDQGRPVVE